MVSEKAIPLNENLISAIDKFIERESYEISLMQFQSKMPQIKNDLPTYRKLEKILSISAPTEGFFKAKVSPETAYFLIQNFVKECRPLSKKVVFQFMKDMKSKNWDESINDPIMITKGENLAEGLRRLVAIILSKKSIYFWFYLGLPDSSILSLGQGKPRLVVDNLSMEGFQSPGKLVKIISAVNTSFFE